MHMEQVYKQKLEKKYSSYKVMKFRTSNFSSNKRRTLKLQSSKLPVTLIRGSMVII